MQISPSSVSCPGHSFQRVFPEGFLLSRWLFWTKPALRWLPAVWESCWASGLLPGKSLPQGKLEPMGRTALPWGGGFAAVPGHQGWRGLQDSVTPNPGVCFESVSDRLGVLDTKQHRTLPPPRPIYATVNFVFRLLSWVTNFIQWNQGLFDWVFSLLLIYLKVHVSYFRSLLIVFYGKMLEHILQMWLFCFVFSFAWSLCHNVSCCCLLSFYEVPENYFIYASQVTLRPWNHLMINRLSLGAYLIDILWTVMPVLQKLNSFVYMYCCLQCSMVLLNWMLLFNIFFL